MSGMGLLRDYEPSCGPSFPAVVTRRGEMCDLWQLWPGTGQSGPRSRVAAGCAVGDVGTNYPIEEQDCAGGGGMQPGADCCDNVSRIVDIAR